MEHPNQTDIDEYYTDGIPCGVLAEQAKLEMMKVKSKGPVVWIGDYEDGEDEKPLSPSGVRMKRKRLRENNSEIFWRLRLKTGTSNLEMIRKTFEKAPKIIEQARLKVVLHELSDYASIFPERCATVTESDFKKCDAKESVK